MSRYLSAVHGPVEQALIVVGAVTVMSFVAVVAVAVVWWAVK